MSEEVCRHFKSKLPCLKGKNHDAFLDEGGWYRSWLLCYIRDSKLTELGAIACDTNCGEMCRKESVAALEMLANGFSTGIAPLLWPAMVLDGFVDSMENREEAFRIIHEVYANQHDNCTSIRRYAYQQYHKRSMGEDGLPLISIPAGLDNKLIETEKDGWLRSRMKSFRRRGY